MPDPFDSSYRKLERAEKHFNDLDAKVRAFVNGSPYHEVVEPHPEMPDHVIHKVKPRGELSSDFDDMGDAFGEFVQNLRAALDNTGYAIAVAIGKPDAKNCNFPFARSIDQMINAVGRCADLPREIQSLFCGFQPYLGGDDLLFAVNEACNTDKHKLAVPLFNVFIPSGIAVGGTRFFQMPLHHKWDSAKNEMELFTVGPPVRDASGSSPQKDFEYNLQFKVFIACDKIEGVVGQPILGVTHAMGCKVHGIIRAIEAESRRLGIVK